MIDISSVRRRLSPVLQWFATGPDAPPLGDAAAVRRLFTWKRTSVMLSVTFGYGLFYTCRINFSVVKQPMLDGNVLSATEMGLIGTAMLAAYAVGKLINGFLADRSNIRRFMSAALLLSAVVNLAIGSSTSFILIAALWGLNGWFQSIGSAPSVVALSHWFSPRERGRYYGIWSCCHSLGEGFTFAVTALLVSGLGWRWGFWGPGLLCVLAALLLSRTLADRPQTYGLPPVSVYRNDASGVATQARSVGGMQVAVLKNPAVWVLGLASAAMYVARYGVNNWGVLFLQQARGYSLAEAGALLSLAPFFGLAGSVSSGFISDFVFRSQRRVPALVFGLLETAALVGLLLAPAGHRLLDAALIAAFGFAMGALVVFIGGLMAVDICPQGAAGAAMGLVGMFSYIGAAIQDSVSGLLLDAGKTVVAGKTVYDFDLVLGFWIGASVLSLLFATSLWRVQGRGRVADLAADRV